MKNIGLSNINHAAILVGGIALFNLVASISSYMIGTGDLPTITVEDAANIVPFVSAVVILYKRNFTEVKPTLKRIAKRGDQE